MNDMEEEFQKLVQEMYQKVQDREQAGELSVAEADELRTMISDRVQTRSWNDSGCSYDSEYQDDGWSPSQVCW